MRVLLVPSADIAPINNLKGTKTLLRCQKAVELLKTGDYDILVLSGGQCHPWHIETQPAAMTMAQWFAKQGVSVNTIICECKSLDTYKSVMCTIDQLKIHGLRHEITVVSQWQHAIRFAITFLLGYGIRIKRAPLHYPMSLKDSVKEWLFILYHLYDRRGTKLLARKNRIARTYDEQSPGGNLRGVR